MDSEVLGDIARKYLPGGVLGTLSGLWIRGQFLRGSTKKQLRQQINKTEKFVGLAYEAISKGANSGWAKVDRPIEKCAKEIWSLLKTYETLTWWANRSGNQIQKGCDSAELLELFGAFDRTYCKDDNNSGQRKLQELRTKSEKTIAIIENIPSAIDEVRNAVGLHHPRNKFGLRRKNIQERFPFREDAIQKVKNDDNLTTDNGVFLTT